MNTIDLLILGGVIQLLIVMPFAIQTLDFRTGPAQAIRRAINKHDSAWWWKPYWVVSVLNLHLYFAVALPLITWMMFGPFGITFESIFRFEKTELFESHIVLYNTFHFVGKEADRLFWFCLFGIASAKASLLGCIWSWRMWKEGNAV